MKKELLVVKELAAELHMGPKSIQRAYRKRGDPRAVVSLLSRCCTWIHLATSD
jgi:DNA-binding transcriptional regulator YhcF (GntR family)